MSGPINTWPDDFDEVTKRAAQIIAWSASSPEADDNDAIVAARALRDAHLLAGGPTRMTDVHEFCAADGCRVLRDTHLLARCLSCRMPTERRARETE